MLFYAYGGKAPSGKDIPGRWLYEMCLDYGWLPDQVRALNPVDREKLKLVRNARYLAQRQRKQDF